MGRGRIIAIAPGCFVLLWATGFVVAREGVRYADPLTLVAMRFAIAFVLLAVLAMVTGARRLTRREAFHSIAAGVTALVTGLQPLLSACVAGPLLKERVLRLQWLGLAIGLGGVALVVERKVHFDSGTTAGLGLAIAALVGITAGTLYQRRFCTGIDLRSGSACQYATGAVASLVLSTGAILGFLWLIRRMEVARVASLFYLVPPLTALMAWPWFGETVSWAMAGGMALAAAGVALVQKGAR